MVIRGAMLRPRFIATVLAAMLVSASLSFSQVQLEAHVDSTHYKIGDWVRVKVTALMAPSVSSISPLVRDSLGGFEVLRVQSPPPQVDETGKRQVWNLRLTSFDTTSVVIPPIEFGYTIAGDSTPRTARTQAIPVSITGPTVDPKGDIKDIKEPLRPPWAFEDFIPYIIVLLLLGLAAGAYFFYRWRMKKKAGLVDEFVPQIPPHELALGALREVEDKKLWQQGKVKEYYSEVTEIIRRFFEGRFRIIALEMTSDQILQQLKSVPEAQPLMKEISSFFLTADLVKFAKYAAAPNEHESELRWAYEIVRSMIPRPPVDEEAGAEVHADVR